MARRAEGIIEFRTPLFSPATTALELIGPRAEAATAAAEGITESRNRLLTSQPSGVSTDQMLTERAFDSSIDFRSLSPGVLRQPLAGAHAEQTPQLSGRIRQWKHALRRVR